MNQAPHIVVLARFSSGMVVVMDDLRILALVMRYSRSVKVLVLCQTLGGIFNVN